MRAFSPVRRKVKSISARIGDKLYGRVSVECEFLTRYVPQQFETSPLLFLLDVFSSSFWRFVAVLLRLQRCTRGVEVETTGLRVASRRISHVSIASGFTILFLSQPFGSSDPATLVRAFSFRTLSLRSYFVNHPTNFELASFETFTGPTAADWTETRSDRFVSLFVFFSWIESLDRSE